MSDEWTRQFAQAAAAAMRQPGREATAYSEADRCALAEQARRLLQQASRLTELVTPVVEP